MATEQVPQRLDAVVKNLAVLVGVPIAVEDQQPCLAEINPDHVVRPQPPPAPDDALVRAGVLADASESPPGPWPLLGLPALEDDLDGEDMKAGAREAQGEFAVVFHAALALDDLA